MKRVAALVLVAIAVASIASLMSGAAYLGNVLPGGLPVGNALAALGLVSVAGIPALLAVPGSSFRLASLVVLGAAAAWLPASIALAGNLALNFTGWRGTVWFVSSLAIHLGALCTLAWWPVDRLLAVRRRAKVG